MASAAVNRGIDKNYIAHTPDPVLAMLGVGRHLWERETGEQFIDRLRAEDLPPAPSADESARPESVHRGDAPAEAVWRRIEASQGEPFHTATQLPFTFEVDGNGIWFFRGGRRINRKLTRGQTEVAISRCPLKSTTEIKDLIDYPYLYALLMDKRIRGDAW